MAVNKRNKTEAEDVQVLYDLAWKQMHEDRAILMDQYKSLKEFFTTEPGKLAFNGDVLVKSSEALIKQTAQVLELVKLAKKAQEEDGSLSSEDMEEVRKEMESHGK